jgi:hypothetical protein
MIQNSGMDKECVCMLDQRLLPAEEKYLMLRSYDEVAEAIKNNGCSGCTCDWRLSRNGDRAGSQSVRGYLCRGFGGRFRLHLVIVMGRTRPTRRQSLLGRLNECGHFQARKVTWRR